jgi:hypothetical protein
LVQLDLLVLKELPALRVVRDRAGPKVVVPLVLPVVPALKDLEVLKVVVLLVLRVLPVVAALKGQKEYLARPEQIQAQLDPPVLLVGADHQDLPAQPVLQAQKDLHFVKGFLI